MKRTIILLFHLCVCLLFSSCANTPINNGDTKEAAGAHATDGKEDHRIHTEKESMELQTITVGALRTDDARDLGRFVAYHNSVSTEYHAEIKYYEDENQIRLDIASGNAPDILELRGVNIPLNDQNFLDLLPYIERDESLSIEDFSGNLPEALKIDGKIHLLPDSFSVYTVKGRSADVGDEPGWSLQDLEKLLEEKGEQVRAFSAGMPPEAILHWFYIASVEQLVDAEHYRCDFTSETFIDMLRFCASSKMQMDSDRFIENDDPLLTFTWIQSVDVLMNANTVWSGQELAGREAVTYIGFPNTERNCGSAFGAGYSEQQYAIPANSRQPEAAWAYLRVMLGSEWQQKTKSMPVMESDMLQVIEDALQKYEVTWEEAGVDRFMDLIERMDAYAYEFNTITLIMEEEAQACFSGEKSAEETAALIQNRVTMYLNEIKPGGE
ncbi:MAG: extracellular solute-binding protein [Lachnospiraceae bacterium]|nr:extracellular solute-binding protein [Lachnospiraceae bacterium]